MNFTLGVDGLSLIMICSSAIVLVAAVWFTGEIEHHENAFYACLLFIAGGAIGAFASLNLFFFYAFHELALIPTFLLIGIWGTGNRPRCRLESHDLSRVRKYHSARRLDHALSQPCRKHAQSGFANTASRTDSGFAADRSIYLVLLIGFGILISLVPFHTWAPEAYACAPAPAAMLHAGVLKKFGLYGLLRLALPLLPEGARQWSGILLIVLLLGNIIYIGLVTIAQQPPRLDARLLERHAHGYIFLGIASANILGTTGAAILMFAHGISIALLFGITGEIRKRVPSLDFERWADWPKRCRWPRLPSGSEYSRPSGCLVSPISPPKSWLCSVHSEMAPIISIFIFSNGPRFSRFGVS